jgi:hypothetical protein
MNLSQQEKAFLANLGYARSREDGWNFITTTIDSLRNKLSPLISNGKFYGIISKQQAADILRNQEEGTILLRSSSTTAGAIVISVREETIVTESKLSPDLSTEHNINLFISLFKKIVMRPDKGAAGGFKVVPLSNDKRATKGYVHLIDMITKNIRQSNPSDEMIEILLRESGKEIVKVSARASLKVNDLLGERAKTHVIEKVNGIAQTILGTAPIPLSFLSAGNKSFAIDIALFLM